jgi:VanZ family protein
MYIFRLAGWVLAAAIVVLSLVPAHMRPETGAPHDFEHFAIYALTGLAFGVGYTWKENGDIWKEASIAIGLLLFALIVELAQLAVPGRHARLSDFVVDSLAGVTGIVAASVSRRVLTQSA